jgi:hypothetical protein
MAPWQCSDSVRAVGSSAMYHDSDNARRASRDGVHAPPGRVYH